MTLEITEDEKMILQAALYEYAGLRGPTVVEYVDRRYPVTEGYDANFRAQKIKSVAKNLQTAADLRSRLFM